MRHQSELKKRAKRAELQIYVAMFAAVLISNVSGQASISWLMCIDLAIAFLWSFLAWRHFTILREMDRIDRMCFERSLMLIEVCDTTASGVNVAGFVHPKIPTQVGSGIRVY